MGKHYTITALTPAMREEIEALLTQQSTDPDLHAAVEDLLTSGQSTWATVTEEDAVALVVAMTEDEAKDALVQSIGVYRLLLKCAAALLLTASRQPGRARKATSRRAASARKSNIAMREIHLEWKRMQAGEVPYIPDPQFARVMADKYEAIKNEGSIKNACVKWRKGELPSS